MTLVEALVTICVIGFLVVLLFPSGGEKGEIEGKIPVKQDVAQISTALVSYYAEYGKFPVSGAGNINSPELMRILMGGKGENGSNSREVVFLEVPKAKSHKNGVEIDDAGKIASPFLDSWGNPYEIRIDERWAVEGPEGVVRKSVIVWSRGDPRKKVSYNDPTKWIKSWE